MKLKNKHKNKQKTLHIHSQRILALTLRSSFYTLKLKQGISLNLFRVKHFSPNMFFIFCR